jgi:hypothetical protein
MTKEAVSLPKSLRKFASIIESVSDERGSDEGYWVYLKPGLWSPMDETHCIHENTLAECVYALKGVEKCPKCESGKAH